MRTANAQSHAGPTRLACPEEHAGGPARQVGVLPDAQSAPQSREADGGPAIRSDPPDEAENGDEEYVPV